MTAEEHEGIVKTAVETVRLAKGLAEESYYDRPLRT